MSNINVNVFLFCSIVFLSPFQLIGLPIGTSRVDISAIFLILLVLWNIKKGLTRNAFLFLLFAVLPSLIYLAFDPARIPLVRMVGSVLFLFCYTFVYSFNKFQFAISWYLSRFIFLVRASAILCFIYYLFQLVVLNEARPSIYFSEPSVMGLFAGSILIAEVFYCITKKELKIFPLFMISISCCMAFSSFSATLFTCMIALIICIISTSRLTLNWLVAISLLVIPIFAALNYFLMQSDHFTSRINALIDPFSSGLNISSLSWLSGFDQFIQSLLLYPLVGAGLGGTGYFPLEGEIVRLRDAYEIGYMNLYDAYSLFFRLGIELGLVCLVIVIILLSSVFLKSLSTLRIGLLRRIDLNSRFIPNFSWLIAYSLSLWLGLLLKDPLYGGSLLTVAVVCIPLLRDASFYLQQPNGCVK